MKAYITCPVTITKDRIGLLPEIEKISKENGLETFVFQIGGEPAEVFERDYNQLKSCDILIAEVSEASHGVGIEIGLSFSLNLRRILLHEKGTKITLLAQGIPDTEVIEYENLEDLKEKLSSALDRIK